LGLTGFDSKSAETGILVLIDKQKTKVINLFKENVNYTAKIAA
jgi:hypothetical protein